MLVSTRGIVLYQADYSETSLITKIYTEQFGLQSYIVKGVRRKGSPIKRNLFGPLSLVDIVAYKKENTGLHLMKDVSCERQLNLIAGDIARSSVMVFMNELLYRSIAGEMPDKRLYTFIYDSLLELDEPDCRPALMPLLFAWKLTSFLGFGLTIITQPIHLFSIWRKGISAPFRLLILTTCCRLPVYCFQECLPTP
jgi:DNA repair protein RecO (recombination protein O)